MNINCKNCGREIKNVPVRQWQGVTYWSAMCPDCCHITAGPEGTVIPPNAPLSPPEANPIDTYNFEVAATVIFTVQAGSLEEAWRIAAERTKGGRFMGTIAEGCLVNAVDGARLHLTAIGGHLL